MSMGRTVTPLRRSTLSATRSIFFMSMVLALLSHAHRSLDLRSPACSSSAG